jgi:hypothetical protein
MGLFFSRPYPVIYEEPIIIIDDYNNIIIDDGYYYGGSEKKTIKSLSLKKLNTIAKDLKLKISDDDMNNKEKLAITIEKKLRKNANK